MPPHLCVLSILLQVNSPDDNGVLTGNWSGDYTGGVPPLKWSSSAAILLEYMETNRPVRFGQCFVFSGIVTTGEWIDVR